MERNVLVIPLVVTSLLLVLAVMTGDFEDSKQRVENYCEMHRLYLKSNGENGWPDYNGNYSEVCGD
jgi:hypothetical protein